ncbi:hydrogenase expression/formation protein HypE [Novipirellula artificiosorum]|uniref:Hydrogenase expression/formation protein HypE n=1 Tax=Novipirellula artificiosorum TaxID=2528016 RepID=A0A5C6DEU5_9BACT|nr:hydrogenase expression/formation protein HypE [Novipirellula artificiosorum]TWU34271.1 Hydrogenase expression/formation protein HypE [Novipirellula artificiosorum]
MKPSTLNIASPLCPVPLRDYPQVILAHGGGGKLSAELIEHIFAPAFANEHVTLLSDSTPLCLPSQRIAVSTDSFVVQPLFFPGGSIGDLAVNGTVNDLAMSGARPMYLTAGFILEEGFEMEQLIRIAKDMGRAARDAGVAIIAGDTKVVERGHGDGCYINTSGIGVLPAERKIAVDQAKPGDAVILSGSVGDHGVAIMSVREGLDFESPILSDCASLADLVQKMLDTSTNIRAMRDPTRGGVAMSLNEIAAASRCGIELDDECIPIKEPVRSACEFLGLDPLLVANEGKLIAIVAKSDADQVLNTMRAHPLGCDAAIVGHVVEDDNQLVVSRTAVGTKRIVSIPVGEQLPRIC